MIKYKLQSYSDVLKVWSTIAIYYEENIDLALKLKRYDFQEKTFRKVVID